MKTAAEARDAAILYLQLEGTDAPNLDLDWEETNVTQLGLVGGVTMQYTADGWTVAIAYNVVRPDLTKYQVIVSNDALGFTWEGTVEADSAICPVQ
jgi:hypothetical protein